MKALKRSFQKLINRHPSLRTTYSIREGKPVQEVHGYQDVNFKETDVSGLSEEQVKEKVKAEYSVPFNLEAGPVFKVTLFRISEDEHVMLINMHHICSDGWSIGIILNELKDIYANETDGKDTDLQPPLRYQDLIKSQEEFLNSAEAEKQWNYWKEELAGELPVLNLPADKPRPVMQTFNGATVYFSLEKELVDSLRKLAQKEGVTLFVMLLSAYQILLHKYSSQDDIITGTPTAGRNKTEFDKIVGYFINPVAVRGDLTGDPLLSDFLKQIKRKVLGAVANQDIPFQVIVERILNTRDPSRSPVFQTFFGLQGVPKSKEVQELVVPGNKGVRINYGKLELEPYDLSQQEGQFDLMLEFFEGENKVTGVIKYNTDIFSKERIERMAGHAEVLLKGIIENPNAKISELPFITTKEKEQINEWNSTDVKYDTSKLIHEIISANAATEADRTAVEIGDKKLSYKELEEETNKLANYLISKGVKPDTLVGVVMDRSLEMMIALLGIMKSGGAYVPIDPSYPEERVSYMIEDSQVELILTSKELSGKINSGKAEMIILDDSNADYKSADPKFPGVKLDPDNIAYMIYTSGSTGKPKGAMNTHGGILNRLLWMKDYLNVSKDDNIFQKTSFSFDVSVWEFFLPLMYGAKLVFAKPEGQKDTSYLTQEIHDKKITIMHFVPSMLQAFLEDEGIAKCNSLKKVVCSGEELTVNLQNNFFSKFKDTELHNLYGPTEAAVDVTYWQCDKDSKLNFVPIGKAIANTKIYILDPSLNLLPVGVPGELHIGGVQVARGYLNREELTKEKFIPDPFNNGGRLYKTGDLVRYMDDGNIEYLGRIDNQIKIRGFRIELGEIEFVLNNYPGIREAVVLAKEIRQGDRRLIAYVVSSNGRDDLLNELRNYLKEKLPEYMVPSQFVFIEHMPLSQNGKADRKALSALEFSRDDLKTEFKEAEKPVEEILANIWKEVLVLDKVGINDNFFELGGDSIISIQIIFKANQQGLKITPKQIFRFQTIAELASVIETDFRSDAEQGIVTGEIDLTPVQSWFFETNDSDPAHFNHSVLLKAGKKTDTDALRKAAEKIIAHHDALRLRFTKDGNIYRQENAGVESLNDSDNELRSGDKIIYSSADISSKNDAEQTAFIRSDIEKLQTDFDLAKPPLIRIRLYTTDENNGDKILILIHHLAVDGISWRIIIEDLYRAYKGEELPSKTTSYKEWSSMLRKFAGDDKLKEEIKHWEETGSGNFRTLPKDLDGDNSADSAVTLRTELDEEMTNQLLKDAPKTYNTQINDLLLSALLLAFNKLTGKSRMVTDLEGHGREDVDANADLTRTVGWFTSLFPVILKTDNADDIGFTIKSVKETLRQVPGNGIGFGVLRYLSKDNELRKRLSEVNPEIVFNYLGQLNVNVSENSGWKLGSRLIVADQSALRKRIHILEVNSIIADGKLKIDFTYSRNIHKEDTIKEFADHYMTELKNIIAHCLSGESGGYTPSDFSASGLNQQELDDLLENLK